MGAISISVYGPANGFAAYRFPGASPCSEDSLALSSAEASLSVNSSAIKFSRITGLNGSNVVRTAIFRQIFEPNVRRRGHTFGAAIDFHDAIAEPTVCIQVLNALCETIEDICVSDGSFCSATGFNQFAKIEGPSRLGKNFEEVFSALSENTITIPDFRASITPQKGTLFYATGSATSRFDEAKLLEWFIFGIGCSSWSKLLCSSDNEITLGPLIRQIDNPFKLDYESTSAFFNTHQALSEKIKEQTSNIIARDKNITELEARLTHVYRSDEHQRKRTPAFIPGSQSSAANQVEKSLSKKDLEEIRKLFFLSLTEFIDILQKKNYWNENANASNPIDGETNGEDDKQNVKTDSVLFWTLTILISILFCILLVLLLIKHSGV